MGPKEELKVFAKTCSNEIKVFRKAYHRSEVSSFMSVKITFMDGSDVVFHSNKISQEGTKRRWSIVGTSNKEGLAGDARTFTIKVKQFPGCKYIDMKYVNGKTIEWLFQLLFLDD